MSDIQTNTTDTVVQKQPSRPPLWKQIAGALGGAAIAFALYTGYQTVEPTVTAWVSLPMTDAKPAAQAKINLSDPTASPETQERIARRAKAIAERFVTRPINAAAPDSAPEDVMMEKEETSSASSEATAPAVTEAMVEDPQPEAPIEPAPVEAVAPIVEEPVEETPDETDVMAQAETDAEAPRAPSLPSSGIGLWIAGIFALVVAIGWEYRRQSQNEVA